MDDVEGMEIVEAAEQLLEDDFDDVLVEVLALLDEVDDGAASAVLCYHVIPIFALEHLVELNDIGMIQLLQQLQFCKDRCLLVLAESLLLYNLDGPFFARLEADGAIDAAEGALSNYLLKLVVSLYIFIAQLNELLLADLYPALGTLRTLLDSLI